MTHDPVDLHISHIEYILHDIISKGAPDKDQSILSNLVGEGLSLMGRGFVNAFLHDAAAMFVASYLDTLLDHGVIEELVALVVPAVKYFLYDMIAVDVLGHLLDTGLHKCLDELEVASLSAHLQDLLDRSCAMSIFTELNWVSLHRLNDLCKLKGRTALC